MFLELILYFLYVVAVITFNMIVSGGWDTDGVPAGHALCEPGGEDCTQ